jgi:hypothetical protein
MKLLVKLSLLAFVVFSFNACMAYKQMKKDGMKENANFMLMKKQNKNSHYHWMTQKK